MAATAAELAALERDKPNEWRWALFASVLVQRTTPLLPRLRDSELGFTLSATARIRTGTELATTLVGLIDEMLSTARQLDSFMGSTAFMRTFGDPTDDSAPDAEAITHIAHRVMDFHDRFLELSERCRELCVPSQYADVLTDCARLLDIPLPRLHRRAGQRRGVPAAGAPARYRHRALGCRRVGPQCRRPATVAHLPATGRDQPVIAIGVAP